MGSKATISSVKELNTEFLVIMSLDSVSNK
jgi:hypothetical protein